MVFQVFYIFCCFLDTTVYLLTLKKVRIKNHKSQTGLICFLFLIWHSLINYLGLCLFFFFNSHKSYFLQWTLSSLRIVIKYFVSFSIFDCIHSILSINIFWKNKIQQKFKRAGIFQIQINLRDIGTWGFGDSPVVYRKYF